MDISIKNPSSNARANESTLIWAVICSILLHLLLLAVIPNFKFDAIKEIPQELTIQIQQPKPPEPAVVPEPPKPVEPIKPVSEPIKPLPKKMPKPDPIPVQDIKPEPVTSEPPPPPAVITAAPKADAPPVITAPPPPPEPPKKIEPDEADISAALSQYGGTLGRAIAKHKQYPKIAQMRGWQGDCLLDLKIDGSGNVLSANVKESSGFEALDKQALEMVRKASPFPAPPEALRGRSFDITVPVSFKLE
ncbi:MAG TPA: energy transducer TonB [Methylotenera sp.]|nr:energy transducer TonB [Methylotenera sp.]HPV45735.1 energy transducer TonB [Methylotenera sp.]